MRVGSFSLPIILPFSKKSLDLKSQEPVGSPLAVSSPKASTRNFGLKRTRRFRANSSAYLYRDPSTGLSGNARFRLKPSPAPVPFSSAKPLK